MASPHEPDEMEHDRIAEVLDSLGKHILVNIGVGAGNELAWIKNSKSTKSVIGVDDCGASLNDCIRKWKNYPKPLIMVEDDLTSLRTLENVIAGEELPIVFAMFSGVMGSPGMEDTAKTLRKLSALAKGSDRIVMAMPELKRGGLQRKLGRNDLIKLLGATGWDHDPLGEVDEATFLIAKPKLAVLKPKPVKLAQVAKAQLRLFAELDPDFVQMSKYIDVSKYHKYELDHPFFVEMMDKMVEIIRGEFETGGSLVEIGAGTGLFTNRAKAALQNFDFIVTEPDKRCFELLTRTVKEDARTRLVRASGEAFRTSKPVEVIVNSFAHHHIPKEKRLDYCRNVYANLKNGGIYIVGDEFIRDFASEEERRRNLKLHHNFLINLAESERHPETAELERIFLEKSIAGEEYKISCEIFEREMALAGFEVERKIKVGPKNVAGVGGIYVYLARKLRK